MIMGKYILFFVIVFSLGAVAHVELPTARYVDTARYIGKWYTVTSMPQFYTRTCTGQTAEYALLNEKNISIQNVCLKENGKTAKISGIGTIRDAPNNARLTVRFKKIWWKMLGLKSEYVIIKLSDAYDTVMVGSTNRASLWIMSRTPTIDPEILEEYKTLARDLGFKVQKLENSKY